MIIDRRGSELTLTSDEAHEQSVLLTTTATYAAIGPSTPEARVVFDGAARDIIRQRHAIESPGCFPVQLSGEYANVALHSLFWYVESIQHQDDTYVLVAPLQPVAIQLYLEAKHRLDQLETMKAG